MQHVDHLYECLASSVASIFSRIVRVTCWKLPQPLRQVGMHTILALNLTKLDRGRVTLLKESTSRVCRTRQHCK